MGSLILFVLGVAAPLAAALGVLWIDERRRSYTKIRFDRLTQDNRGLKLALGSRAGSSEPLPASTEAERREVNNLAAQLAHKGILLEWLRLGTKAPAQAGAQLLGVSPQDAAHVQQALADWGAQGTVAALAQLKERLAAVAEMELIWADPHANVERDSTPMLERAMWVFEPEFVVREGHFAIDPRIGAVAKPLTAAGLFQGQAREGEPTLVVELKSARTTIGADHQLQAWSNVRELIRGGAIRERDPVDVYVVGGAVDELDGNPRIEGRYRNVRITSFDYTHLIARAKRLTFGLYDELKDHAPFLRRHREDIVASQRAAEEQAANEASAPGPESEPDLIRHEEYADGPRRGEYEGEHIVIGARKTAAE